MLLVPIQSVQPGMTLAEPVLHPERDDLLLISEGHTLDQQVIDHLISHGVSHVWISFPGLEEIDGLVNQRIARGHMQLYRVLNDSIDELERRVSVKVNIAQYRRAVHHMLAEIVSNPDHDVLTHQLAMCGPQMAGHLANCSYLSLLVGAHLTGYLRAQRRSLPPDVAENTAQLGVGALLHDIGKINMPDDLRDRCITDPEASWPEYQMHVTAGYEEVREHVSAVAANVVLHHHQRYDGSGFPAMATSGRAEPAPLTGQKIHVFARILSVVDVFDRLLCPHGRPVPAIVALSQLRSERFAGWFDPVIVEALYRLVPPFMVGSVVRLSDGHEAVVVNNHPEAPCKPRVRIIQPPIGSSSQPSHVTSRTLDLRMCRGVVIAEVDGMDVRRYLYTGEFEAGASAA